MKSSHINVRPKTGEVAPTATVSKTCSRCLIEKTLDHFHQNGRGKLGRESRCAICVTMRKVGRRRRSSAPQIKAKFCACIVGTPSTDAIRNSADVIGETLKGLINEECEQVIEGRTESAD